MTRRLHAALLSVLALILGAGAVVLTTAGPAASSDPGGTVTFTPSSGGINDPVPWTQVAVSDACPEHYQDSLEIALAFASGDTGDIVYGLTEGAPYSAPFTARIPAASTDTTYVNSIADAFGGSPDGVPSDGTYPVHVVCHSADPATYPDAPMFTAFITVSGTDWAVKEAAAPTATTLALTADPTGHAVVSHNVTLKAAVTPAGAAGTVNFYRDGTIPIGSAAVSGGVATATLSGVSDASTKSLKASFVPDDATEYGPSDAALDYPFVDESSITALDDTGNNLADDPTLGKGQKITLTATGFLPAAGAPGTPGETVHVQLDTGASALPDASPDAAGKVANYAVTLPDDLPDGAHGITLKGAVSGISASFAFKSGADGSTDGSTSGSSAGATDGSTDGSTGGTSAGSTAGDDSSGASGAPGSPSSPPGGSTGDAGSGSGGSSGGPTGGSSGGSSGSGPLAATGADGVLPLGALAVLMVVVGGYAVHRVRRDGRLLSFGSGPRD